MKSFAVLHNVLFYFFLFFNWSPDALDRRCINLRWLTLSSLLFVFFYFLNPKETLQAYTQWVSPHGHLQYHVNVDIDNITKLLTQKIS